MPKELVFDVVKRNQQKTDVIDVELRFGGWLKIVDGKDNVQGC